MSVVDYKKYDFDRPDKFSLEHIRSLETIFSMYCRNFSTVLSAFIRLPTEMEVQSVQQLSFQNEYVDARERDRHAFVILENSSKQYLMQLDVSFILSLHSKLLGGDFTSGDVPEEKDLTEFEQITVEMLIEEYVLSNLNESFKGIQEDEFKLIEIVTDPQYAKITLPQDMISLVDMRVRIQDVEKNIQFIIPFLSIEDNIEKLNTDTFFKDKEIETPKEQLAYLYSNLERDKQVVTANLGESEITLKEFEKLEIGDVIPLDYISNDISCSVNGKKKFKAKIGTKGGRYAVKIVDVLQHKSSREVEERKAELVKAFLENNKLEEE